MIVNQIDIYLIRCIANSYLFSHNSISFYRTYLYIYIYIYIYTYVIDPLTEGFKMQCIVEFSRKKGFRFLLPPRTGYRQPMKLRLLTASWTKM